MADNTRGGSESGTAPLIATDEVTYSGETADVQLVKIVSVTGTEGSKTVTDISGPSGLNIGGEVTVTGGGSAAIAVTAEDQGGVPVGGSVSHDALDAGGPVKIGGKASTTTPTAVADGDRVDAFFTPQGMQVVEIGAASALLDVSGSSVLSAGDVAHDAADSGNPVKIGGKAISGSPATVAANDRVNAWFNLLGAQKVVLTDDNGSTVLASTPADGTSNGLAVIPTLSRLMGYNGATWDRLRSDTTNGLDVDVTRMPAPHTAVSLTSVSETYTTTQTSTNLIAGTGGQRIYVTGFSIGTGGTTAGLITLYWGTGAFSRGTSPTLFEAEFAPGTNARPGAVQSFTFPPGGQSATGDNLRITTSAGITCWVTVHYYKA